MRPEVYAHLLGLDAERSRVAVGEVVLRAGGGLRAGDRPSVAGLPRRSVRWFTGLLPGPAVSSLSLPLRRAARWAALPVHRLVSGWPRASLAVLDRRAWLVTGAMAVVYVVWGSTYLAIEVAIATVPPLLLLGARFAVAGALLLAWALPRGDRRGDRLTPRRWLHAAQTAGVLLVAGTGLTALGQTRVTSGTAALLASTVPLWLALIARGAFGERLGARAWLGLVVGLIGVAVLVDPGAGGELLGMLLVLAAAAAWAAGSLRSRVVDAPRRPMVAAGMEMLVAAPMFVVVGLALGEHHRIDPAAVGADAIAAFAYLVLAGSLLAFTAYRWLLANASATLVGTYAYVNPVVAVGLGWAVLGERVGARTALAGVVILLAVVLLVTGRPGEPVPAQPTSGADVFAGSRRWHRARTRLGRLPRVARLYVEPGAPQYRDVGYEQPIGPLHDDPYDGTQPGWTSR
jgi:drug/metabolite transporter (DMT)-like permease